MRSSTGLRAHSLALLEVLLLVGLVAIASRACFVLVAIKYSIRDNGVIGYAQWYMAG